MATQNRIGRRVRGRRERLGMSQADLARLVGVAASEVEDFESGRVRIGAGMLVQLARHLKVPIKFLFSDGKEPSSEDEASGFSEPLHNEWNAEEIVRLIAAFESISGAETRKTVIELAESLAREDYN